MRTPAGLELVGCDVEGKDSSAPTTAEADIRLVAADGRVLDQARSGFLWGRFGTHSVRVPAAAAGPYAVEAVFASGPLAGEATARAVLSARRGK
jgi:hypothetical protein